MTIARDTEAMINARIAQIDQLLSLQLNEILHHPEFQSSKASWRGLKYLVEQSETGDDAEDQGPQRLQEGPAQRPAARARVRPERAVQEGLRGGVRRLRRHAVRRAGRRLRVRQASARTSSCSRRSRNVAAAAHAPFITAASPEHVQPRELHRARRSRATWPRSSTPPSTPSGSRSAQSEDSRYVALALPHILMRLPYGSDDRARSRRSTTRRTSTAPTTTQVPVGQRRLRAGARTHRGVREVRLVRGDPRRRGRRPGRRPADPHLPHRRGRRRAEVPDRDADHRPAREGAGRPRLHSARALQGHRLRGVLRRAVGQKPKMYDTRRGQRERAAVGAAAVHPRRRRASRTT